MLGKDFDKSEFDKDLRDDYVAEMRDIKAPRHLIDQTKMEMGADLSKTSQPNFSPKVIKVKFPYSRLILAAVVVFVIGGSFLYYQQTDQIQIVAVKENQFSMNKDFGKFDSSYQAKKSTPIELVESEDATIIPDFMAEVAPSKLNGQKIQLAQNGNVYYAAFSKHKQYYFVTGKDVTQDAFIQFLKNILKNL
ncbi:hypothetical protein RyT2_04010 [Pseudolactococcus yaeyamensis]